MKLVEFHVANSGDIIGINPDQVTKIGRGILEGTSFIGTSDGKSVDVKESYAEVKILLDKS